MKKKTTRVSELYICHGKNTPLLISCLTRVINDSIYAIKSLCSCGITCIQKEKLVQIKQINNMTDCVISHRSYRVPHIKHLRKLTLALSHLLFSHLKKMSYFMFQSILFRFFFSFIYIYLNILLFRMFRKQNSINIFSVDVSCV